MTDVEGVNPRADDIPDNWKKQDDPSVDTSTYVDKPAVQVYQVSTSGGADSTTGTVRDVYVQFATEGQVGVSYIAKAGSGAIMDFDGAENHADGLGENLDNFGMMTTRRTYNNFVPRDFALLNALPTV